MNRKERLISMLEESPTDSFLLFAMAKEFEKEENWEDACRNYEKIYKIDPNYVGHYYHHAHALIEIDAPSEQIKGVFEKGIQVANELADQHSKAELQNAFTNWEMENL